jgi:5-methylcytosine-specific restriction enzyme subunit McrC
VIAVADPVRILPALHEWEVRTFKGLHLSEDDHQLAGRLREGGEGRLEVDDLRDGLRVRATAWVGVVRFRNLEVRITPKLAGDQIGLVRLLECVSGIEALRKPKGEIGLDASGTNLLELVSLLLADATEHVLRRGLLAGYIEREEAIPVVRGRILADAQVLKRFGVIDRVHCRFDELEHDVDENRLLSGALRVAARHATTPSLHRRLTRLRAVFDPICDADRLDLPATRKGLSYNRLNSHYERAHQLAWLVLDGLGVDDLLARGATRSFAFLLNMNRLFERFVERLVEAALPPSEYRVDVQHAHSSIIRDLDADKPYGRVIPDVVVRRREASSGRRTAIDAKYKLYDEKRVAASDIYQSFLYAYALGGKDGENLPKALLFYPASEGTQTALRLAVSSLSRRRGAEITALGIPIPAALTELKEERDGPIRQRVRQLIGDSMGGQDHVTAGLAIVRRTRGAVMS